MLVALSLPVHVHWQGQWHAILTWPQRCGEVQEQRGRRPCLAERLAVPKQFANSHCQCAAVDKCFVDGPHAKTQPHQVPLTGRSALCCKDTQAAPLPPLRACVPCKASLWASFRQRAMARARQLQRRARSKADATSLPDAVVCAGSQPPREGGQLRNHHSCSTQLQGYAPRALYCATQTKLMRRSLDSELGKQACGGMHCTPDPNQVVAPRTLQHVNRACCHVKLHNFHFSFHVCATVFIRRVRVLDLHLGNSLW